MSTITPFLMFEGAAQEAMDFYVSLFADGRIESVTRHGAAAPGKEDWIMQARLVLNGQTLICMDSPVPHAFTFTPAISLSIDCESEDEAGRLFAELSQDGKVLMGLATYPFARRFGWTNDRFGVSWQIKYV